MTTKINTARAWGYIGINNKLFPWSDEINQYDGKNQIRVRILRESDYRKLVRAANILIIASKTEGKWK